MELNRSACVCVCMHALALVCACVNASVSLEMFCKALAPYKMGNEEYLVYFTMCAYLMGVICDALSPYHTCLKIRSHHCLLLFPKLLNEWHTE